MGTIEWARRIVKLRKLAASTPFPAEAEAATRLARTLKRRYHITEAELKEVDQGYDETTQEDIDAWKQYVSEKRRAPAPAPPVFRQSEANARREREMWANMRLDPRLR